MRTLPSAIDMAGIVGLRRARLIPVALFILLLIPSFALAQMRLQSGSYVGDGQPSQSISGLGFSPDLVIIKAEDTRPAVIRTSTMVGDVAKELTAFLPLENNLIPSLDGDGFAVGNDSRVNASGVDYTWTAFGGSPGEMTLGTYTGDGFDGRDITGIGFRPGYVVVIPEGPTRPTQRFLAQVGFDSIKFGLAGDATNWIQAFLSDGFQVGDHTSINEAGVTFHYVAWNVTSGRINGSSYRGDGTDNRSIAGAGFRPDYVILKHSSNAEPAVHRPFALSGDNTLHFRPLATISNGIQQLQADGFQIGSGAEVNDGNQWFYWIAFKDSSPTTDLALDKTASDLTPNEGDTLTYTVTLTNNGSDTAAVVQVSDLLPPGVTYVTDTPSQGSYVPGSGLWAAGTLAPGTGAALTLQVSIDPGTAGTTITNLASILSSDPVDPVPANDADSVLITVQSADLVVSKTVNDPSPNEGDTLSYTVTLTNNGPDAATGVKVTDLLPAGLSYVSGIGTSGNYAPGSGLWILVSIAGGSSEVLTLLATVDAGANGMSITNTAVLSAVDQVDPAPGNESDSIAVIVQSADLVVNKSASDPVPNEGDTLTYTIGLTNNGPDPATGIVLTDLLPAGVTYLSNTPSQGTYADGSGLWTVGSLPNGATVFLVINVTLDPGTQGASISNTASVTSVNQGDPAPGDESDSVDIGIQRFLTISASAQDSAILLPGTLREVFRLHLDNQSAEAETLTALTMTNDTSGPGSQPELDAEWSTLSLVVDSGPGAGTDLGTATFSGGAASFAGLALAVPTGETVSLRILGGPSLAAREPDALDMLLSGPGDLAFTRPILPQAEWPLAPPGAFPVDGMSAAQISVNTVGSKNLTSGTFRALVLDVALPSNGYEADVLERLDVVNLGTAEPVNDITAMEIWADAGQPGFDPAEDEWLGAMEHTGQRWEITGLAHPIPVNGLRIFLSLNINEATTQLHTIRLEIPSGVSYGVGMTSGNSGPLDIPVSNPETITISTQDKIIVSANPLATGTVYPGDTDTPLTNLVVTNTYMTAKTLTRVTISNASSGTGSTGELDGEFESLVLHEDGNGNGLYDGLPQDPILGTRVFLDGRAVFGGLSVSIDPGEARHFFLQGDISLTGAADEDELAVFLSGPLDLGFGTPTAVAGNWPVDSGAHWTVDGMVADQIPVLGGGVATVGPGDGPACAMDFIVPSNGYKDDVLNGINVVNLGNADPADIAELRLWRDGGDGLPDTGGGDDSDLGVLTWTGTQWQSLSMSVPMSGSELRLFLSMTLAPAFADSATSVRFAVPRDGIVVASGNDGPLDQEVASAHEFLLSTAPLLANLTLSSASSTVGQTLTVKMVVENQATESISYIAPSPLAINGTGSLLPVSGPFPASFSLAPAARDTFEWVYQADAPGSARFSGQALGTGDVSNLPRSALEATSNLHQIFVEAVELRLTPVESMPFSVSLGQTGIVPLSLTFTHPGGAGSSDILLTRLRIRVEDEAGGDIAPADLFTRVVVSEGQELYQDKTALETTGGEIDLPLGPPFNPTVITSEEPTTLSLRFDIAPTTTVPRFRIVIVDDTSMEARDSNSGAPVAFVLEQGTYPVRSGVATLVAEAVEVQVAARTSSPNRVGPGQTDIPLLSFGLENVGIDGVTSAARVGRFAVGLADTNGVPITDPAGFLKKLEVRAAGQTLFSQMVTEADDDSMVLLLSPINLPVNSPELFDILGDVADSAEYGAFRMFLKEPSSFDIADANTGTPVPATYPGGPVAGGNIVIEARALNLTVSGTPVFPPAVAVGSRDITGISAEFQHAAGAGTAGIRITGLLIGCRDDRGQLLVPAVYLDGLRILWNDVEIASLGNLPSSASLIPVALPDMVLVPGQSANVDVIIDIDAGSPASLLQLTISGADIQAFDANIATPVEILPGAGQDLPLVSGLTRLEPPPRELVVGLSSLMPATLAPDAQSVPTGTLTLHNPASGESGIIKVEHLVVEAADRHFQSINLGKVVKQVSLLRDAVVVATSDPLTPDSTTAWITYPGGLIIPPSEVATLSLLVLLQDSPEADGLRMGFRSSGIHLEQPSGALLAIDVRPEAGHSFPLWTEAGSLSAVSLEESYSNFPNPFAAGREGTTFAYYLPSDGRVSLRIWTPRGEEVVTLIEEEDRYAGMHQNDRWDGRNGRGVAVVNGVYVAELIVRFQDGSDRRILRKVAVMR